MSLYKKVIIILGPPGAGKGTQALLLADKLGLYYFETSKIIENKVSETNKDNLVKVGGKEYFLKEEKKLWEEGKLCSPLLVAFWVNQKIQDLSAKGESIVFAGSPRTLPETKEIMPLITKLYGKESIKILLFELDPEDSIYRNSHRRICELLRHPILFNEETKDLTMCPLDGSKLVRRKKLDDPETIKVRIEEYKKRTLPIVSYLEDNDYNIKRIDASPTPAEVFNNIFKALK
jgi:adenylate kinase